MSVGSYLALMGVWLAGVASPGPDAVLVVRQSALGSRRLGIAAALGIAAGIGVWVTVAMLGLAVGPPTVLAAVQILGGLLLLYLAVATVRAQSPTEAEEGEQPQSSSTSFVLGVATNITNPKAVVFFVAVFATLIPQDASGWDKLAVALLLIAAEAAWFGALAWFASTGVVEHWLRSHARAFARTTSVVFAILAGLVLWAGLRELLT
ncbi:LysE family transporter [Rhodococcus sp. DMU1]|uniref:LysE family translocator n=1 Tax=Rhodococcus sp. DMU1 TaxID=2722825 RepID=UPI00143E6499|nr:LysE family transporter [Rhodococcus sp. DMU1]QIX53954.1 LysE family transporter [Rhodococcus sp. DMU1]